MVNKKELKLAIYESSLDKDDKEKLIDILESTDDEDTIRDISNLFYERGGAHQKYSNIINDKINTLQSSINNDTKKTSDRDISFQDKLKLIKNIQDKQEELKGLNVAKDISKEEFKQKFSGPYVQSNYDKNKITGRYSKDYVDAYYDKTFNIDKKTRAEGKLEDLENGKESPLKRVKKDYIKEKIKKYDTNIEKSSNQMNSIRTKERIKQQSKDKPYESKIHGIVKKYDERNNIKESVYDTVTESVMRTTDDILYNKSAFDSGKTNLCFVTGFSGSGKSTMSKGIKAQVVDMDKIIMYHDRDDSFFKNEPDIVKAFIAGPGKKYRITVEEREKMGNRTFDKKVIADLLAFVKQYAGSHRSQKFVMDGAWIFLFIDPSEIKDYAVYIKGTSAFTSASRAGKRGSNGNTANGKLGKLMYTMKAFGRVTSTALGGRLQKYQKYFGPLYEKQLEMEKSKNVEKDKNKVNQILDKFHKK